MNLQRHLPPAIYCLGLLLSTVLCGCNPTVNESDSSATVEKAPPAEPKFAAADVQALEDAGAKLSGVAEGAVTEVNLHGVDVSDTLATTIAKLGTVTRITINQSSMTDAGWAELGKLSELQLLDLRDCSVSNQQLSSVISNTPKLRALRLNGSSGLTTVDDDGIAQLAKCPELKALALDHLWVSTAGLSKLVNHAKLEELYLKETLVEDDTLPVLAQIKSLKKLRLAQTTVSAAGLAHLAELPIEELDVSECSQIFDPAMEEIGKLTRLKRLNLWRDAITDEGVKHLAGLTEMQWLNLDNTSLSDDGLPSLKGMTQLTFLHLGSTGVSDEGMPVLLALTSLKDLKVTRTAVTEDGVALVQKGLPNVNIQLKYIEGQ